PRGRDPRGGAVSDVEAIIAALDRGEIRVAEKVDGEWRVNEEAKQAILDYFRLRDMEPLEAGPFEYLDKIPLKRDYARLGEGAVLGPNVVLTASVPVIDVTGEEPVEHRGYVPPRSVVLPGTRPREFPAGTYNLACALIVGRRSASTDLKVSLNEALREHGIGA